VRIATQCFPGARHHRPVRRNLLKHNLALPRVAIIYNIITSPFNRGIQIIKLHKTSVFPREKQIRKWKKRVVIFSNPFSYLPYLYNFLTFWRVLFWIINESNVSLNWNHLLTFPSNDGNSMEGSLT
jgi:hypothetical protein